MQPSDIRRKQNVSVKIEYLSEDVLPNPGKPEPVIHGPDFTKVRKWYVNRVFHFLTGVSMGCLVAVALDRNAVVQATAATICAGSFGLAKFLLAGAYRKSGEAMEQEE
jgi:hypothetical protein